MRGGDHDGSAPKRGPYSRGDRVRAGRGRGVVWDANIQPVQIDGLGAEPGVIGNGPGKYHFWTVEYLYSYGSPPANSLAAAFLAYMNSYAAKDILRGQGYIPCPDRGLTAVQAFCRP